MLRVLATNNIHILPLLPPHTLATLTQLLHRAPHFHAAALFQDASYGRKILLRQYRSHWGRLSCEKCAGQGLELEEPGSLRKAEGSAEEEGSGEHLCG